MNNKLVILLPLLMLFLSTGQEATNSKTVWNGVYTTAQAKRGLAVFEANCADCHSPDVDKTEPGARFTGKGFMERWRGYNAGNLFKFMKGSMPQPKPASLSDQQYLDLAAFMFQTNSFPAGDAELTADLLKNVQIEEKDGPKPLPNGALVQLVGCMSRDKTAWVLINSSEPVRTDVSFSSTPEELKAAEARELGSKTFWLQNLDFLSSLDPATLEGHKVHAKGNVIKQPGKERLDITSLVPIASTCGL